MDTTSNVHVQRRINDGWNVYDAVQKICPTPFFHCIIRATCWKGSTIPASNISRTNLTCATTSDNDKCNFTATYQCVSLFLHTSYDVLYGVGHAIVLSNKKRIRHYILFNCAVPIRIPFTVFKVMAIRATVSVWKKNGKRIKLNVLSIHSLFVFGAVSRLIYFSIQFCFCELSVLITSHQIRPRILHFFFIHLYSNLS